MFVINFLKCEAVGLIYITLTVFFFFLHYVPPVLCYVASAVFEVGHVQAMCNIATCSRDFIARYWQIVIIKNSILGIEKCK